MSRPALEVADIFRGHGPAWRRANAGHVSLGQLKVMSAIESCRTAALGGHVARCEKCAHTQISYNSCRNRHCPMCQGAAAKDRLAAREADLGAEALGIGRNRAHCLRGSLEQEIVDDGLVLVGDGGNPRRQREYDVEVRDVQQF